MHSARPFSRSSHYGTKTNVNLWAKIWNIVLSARKKPNSKAKHFLLKIRTPTFLITFWTSEKNKNMFFFLLYFLVNLRNVKQKEELFAFVYFCGLYCVFNHWWIIYSLLVRYLCIYSDVPLFVNTSVMILTVLLIMF